MGRFEKLEFNREDDRHRELRQATGGPDIDAQHFYREAEELYRQGRFEKALRSYSRALEHNSAMAEAWVGQVRMLLELGEDREAKLWAGKALELFRNHPELLAAKGVALARLGEHPEAMKCSDLALAQKGETAWVWQARGEVLLAQGHRTEEFCFAKAVALQPRDWFTRAVIARIYRLYDLVALAAKWLNEALALNTSSAFLWAELAGCQASLGLRAEARRSYRSALDLDSDCPGARLGLIELDASSGLASWFRRVVRFFRGSHGG